MSHHREAGFSAIELVLSVCLVAAIGSAIYFATNRANKMAATMPSPTASPAVSSAAPSPSTLPVAKSYTLKYERLTFGYPDGFSLADTSIGKSDINPIDPGSDLVTLTKTNGLGLYITTGAEGRGGGCENCKVLKSTPLTVLGKAYHLNYISSDGGPLVDSVILAKSSTDIIEADVPGKNVRSTVSGDILPMTFTVNYISPAKKNVAKSVATYDADLPGVITVLSSLRY